VSRYSGKIKVVCVDLLCFPADPQTLDPLGTGVFDQWAWSDPEDGPVETIDIAEWQIRRNRQWLAAAGRWSVSA